jgi:hypothetical protein
VHDHDSELGVLVRKVFIRTALHIPMFIRRPAFPGGLSSGPRAWVSVAALLALLSVALPLLLGPVLALVPAAFLALFVAGDLPMHRFVARLRSPLFLLYFVTMHFLLNLVIAAAALAGVLAWLGSARFRTLYDVLEPAR